MGSRTGTRRDKLGAWGILEDSGGPRGSCGEGPSGWVGPASRWASKGHLANAGHVDESEVGRMKTSKHFKF